LIRGDAIDQQWRDPKGKAAGVKKLVYVGESAEWNYPEVIQFLVDCGI